MRSWGLPRGSPEAELAHLCHNHGVPFAVDLGSGSADRPAEFGLPREPTPNRPCERRGYRHVQRRQAARRAAGRPYRRPRRLVAPDQAKSVEAGVARRQDDHCGAGGGAALHADPDRLGAASHPAVVARPIADIRAWRQRICPLRCRPRLRTWHRRNAAMREPDRSGALPTQAHPQRRARDAAAARRRGAGARPRRSQRLSRPAGSGHRSYPGWAFILDLRCLEDEAAFVDQLARARPRAAYRPR